MANGNKIPSALQDPTNIVLPGAPVPNPKAEIDTTGQNLLEKFGLNNIRPPESPPGGRHANFKSPTGNTIYNVDLSSYQKYINRPFSLTEEDADDLRARAQTFGEKALYAVPKLFTRVGTNVAGGTIGLLYGGAAFFSDLPNGLQSASHSFFDNSFQRGLDGINNYMDETLPHYYTKAEQEYGFFKSAFGPGAANFWLNDFSQGLSFVIGAVLTEGIASGLTNTAAATKTKQLLSRFGRTKTYKGTGTSAADAKAALQGAVGANRRYGAFTALRQLGTGAFYEAGVEARHHFDATLEHLKSMYEQREGKVAEGKDLQDLYNLAVLSSNGVFATNVALVGYGNYMMFPKIFGKGFNATKSSMYGLVKEEAKDGVKRYVSAIKNISRREAIARNTWTIMKVPLYEGFVEEGGQKLMDLAGQHAAENFFLAKKDPSILNMYGELINSTDDVFMDTYGSTEGQKEIGIGFILGALGLPGRTRVKGKNKSKWTWHGGIAGSVETIKNRQQAAEDLVKFYDKYGADAITHIKRHFDAMVRGGHFQTQEDFGQIIDSPFIKKNGEFNSLFTYIANKLEGGLEHSLLDDIQDIRNMSADQFRETFGFNGTKFNSADLNDTEILEHRDKVADNLESKITRIKEAFTSVNGAFTNFGRDQRLMVVHGLSMSDELLAREDAMIEANKKVGLKEDTETTVKSEEVRAERDRKENDSLFKRVKKIWNRFTTKQKNDILALPEAQEIMQKKNIREFTDPTHLEELIFVLASKIMAKKAELDAVKNDDSIDSVETHKMVKGKKVIVPSAKTNRLNRLEKEINDLLDKKEKLTKAIQEGLDPDISSAEQSLLDEWQKSDPSAYAEHHQNVIQRLKDIRKVRAMRHRIIDLYNQLLQTNNISVREGVTWSDKGRAMPRPEVLMMQMMADIEDYASNIGDGNLARMYNKFHGKVIEFEYTHKGDMTVKEMRSWARKHGKLAAIDKRAAEILQGEKYTEQEAYQHALEQNGIPYEQKDRTETYRVHVASQKLETDKDEVLIRIPNLDVVKLLRKKQLLEDARDNGNKEAEKMLEHIEEQLSVLQSSPISYELNFLNNASNIRIVDNTKIIEEQLQAVSEISGEEIKLKLKNAQADLEKFRNQLIHLTNLLNKFQAIENDPESFVKTNKKGNKYFTVNGINYSLDGISRKIIELTVDVEVTQDLSNTALKKSQFTILREKVESLEIDVAVYTDRLKTFHRLKEKLNDVKTQDDFANVLVKFVEESGIGDEALLEQIRNASIFTNNPVMNDVLKGLTPGDDASAEINRLISIIKNEQDLPLEIVGIVQREVERLKGEYANLEAAVNKMKEFVRFKKDGTLDLRSPKEFKDGYLQIKERMQEIEKSLGQLTTEGVTQELKSGIESQNKLFENRAKQYTRLSEIARVLKTNYDFVFNTIKEITYGVAEEINHKENPETTELGSNEEFEAAMKDPASNVYYNLMPVTKSQMAKTAGYHSIAIKRHKELSRLKEEYGDKWTERQERELQYYKDHMRFFKFTEELKNSTKDNYSLMFVNRQTIPDELKDKVIFYDKRTSSYRYKAQYKKKTLQTEDLEDIKVILVDKTGKPVLQKDSDGIQRAVYTSIMDARPFEEVKIKGEEYSLYRFAKEDLEKAGRKTKDYQGRTWYMGTLTSDALAEFEKHRLFRQELLTVSGPRYTSISGTSNGLPIWPNGDPSHRAKASETIVQSENDVKDVRLNIAVNFKNSIVTFEGRKYKFPPGTPFVVKNGRLIPLSKDTLSVRAQNNIYNLLRMYAVNLMNAADPNSKVTPEQANYIHKINDEGNVEVLYSDKTISMLLQDIVYFGKHAKKRARSEFAIYFQGNTLHFGDSQLDINQLSNPEANEDAVQQLKNFLKTLHYQVNNPALKKDIDARSQVNSDYGAALKKWKSKVQKKLLAKGYDFETIKTLGKEDRAKAYAIINKYKKTNPRPVRQALQYDKHIEVVVDDKLNANFVEWDNYTSYLLSGKGRNAEDIPYRLNLYKDRSGKGVDASLSPQFLNVFIVWPKGITVSDLKNLDGLEKDALQKEHNINNETEDLTPVIESTGGRVEEDDIVESPSGLEAGDVREMTQGESAPGEGDGYTIRFKVRSIDNTNKKLNIKIEDAYWTEDNKKLEVTDDLKLELEESLYPELQGDELFTVSLPMMTKEEAGATTLDQVRQTRDTSEDLELEETISEKDAAELSGQKTTLDESIEDTKDDLEDQCNK